MENSLRTMLFVPGHLPRFLEKAAQADAYALIGVGYGGMEPGEAFENEPIAFVYANGLPTEIIATERKARVVAAEK